MIPSLIVKLSTPDCLLCYWSPFVCMAFPPYVPPILHSSEYSMIDLERKARANDKLLLSVHADEPSKGLTYNPDSEFGRCISDTIIIIRLTHCNSKSSSEGVWPCSDGASVRIQLVCGILISYIC